MGQINRRELLTAAATAACVCAMCDPVSLFADDPATQPAAIDVGPKSSFAKDGIFATWSKTNKFAIVCAKGTIYAVTTICTHKGCTIGSAVDHFLCPCHKAQFNLDGTVKAPPAKVSLVRYAISADANGHLLVDKSKSFTDAQWTDPASFVPVDPTPAG